LQKVYGDLHIHIGSALGRPVKITASRQLTLHALIFEIAPRKGLEVIGIVDAGSTLVSAEIEQLLESGEMAEHVHGGFLARNGVLVIPACEIESREGVHLISYLPSLASLKKWQKYMKSRLSNLTLSTQKADAGIVDIINLTYMLEGLFCPAHAFTPHKGIYGFLTDSIAAQIGQEIKMIKALELGLSSDSDMADTVAETRDFTFLSNSDAHSAGNVGREYNLFQIRDKSFKEIQYSIECKEGRRIVANYGMDPRLGKYHRSFCLECNKIAEGKGPVLECECGSKNMVMGVHDRILQIRNYELPHHPLGRPPYNYRVPLKDIPGLGPATLKKLMAGAQSEIDLLENTPVQWIEKAAGPAIAGIIGTMRTGRLPISPGGGGKYGKILKNNSNH
jgi:uncharacterized protein (TIGR00375 family)